MTLNHLIASLEEPKTSGYPVLAGAGALASLILKPLLISNHCVDHRLRGPHSVGARARHLPTLCDPVNKFWFSANCSPNII